MKTHVLIAASFAMLLAANARAGDPKRATLYKDPECGCCEGHARHLRDNGFAVDVRPVSNLGMLRKMLGVPETLAGCHTIMIDGYVVEGHVPSPVIKRLLSERPKIGGISLPGMPTGSPGMEGPKTEPFTIYEIGGAAVPRVFSVD